MYAQLGDIRFDLIQYFNGMTTTNRYDYVEHATIEGKPKLQYIGEALETIDIKINLHTSFCNPIQELKKIKKAASEYKPMDFVFGNGEYKGKYVIEEIGANIIQTFNEGTLIAIDMDMKIKEWVQDRALTMKKAEKKKAKSATATKKKKTSGATTKEEKNKDNVSYKKIVRQE